MVQPILFIDLHGVLVKTPLIFEEYRNLTVRDLIRLFKLKPEEAKTRYDRAMRLWEKEAFDYLRNPVKRKVGKEFLDFLESCDRLFPTLLYEGLSIKSKREGIRTRPFEYSIASKIKALYPEVISTLKRLKDHNYEMYVASSSHSSHIRGLLDANDLNEYFDGLFGFDTVKATKHTLRYYKEMLNTVKVSASSAVMIGNSMHEVLKPRKIGMRTIHIDRERKVPNDIKKLADKSIKDLSPLPTHLDMLQIYN